jgi:enoyl-CoA hydratase/carnithine racemase
MPAVADHAAAGVRVLLAGPLVSVDLDPAAAVVAGWRAFAEVGRSLPGTVRVAVVRGAGAAAWAPVGPPGAPAEALVGAFLDSVRWLSRTDLVSVAVLHGPHSGAASTLALACDLRIFAHGASLAVTDTRRGAVPAFGATDRLVDLVGFARALDLCLTGRAVPAAEAARLGLADLLVPAAELEPATAALVGDLLAPPREAVVETVALLRGARHRAGADQAERDALLRLLRGPDLAEDPPGMS